MTQRPLPPLRKPRCGDCRHTATTRDHVLPRDHRVDAAGSRATRPGCGHGTNLRGIAGHCPAALLPIRDVAARRFPGSHRNLRGMHVAPCGGGGEPCRPGQTRSSRLRQLGAASESGMKVWTLGTLRQALSTAVVWTPPSHSVDSTFAGRSVEARTFNGLAIVVPWTLPSQANMSFE
jgi:hypothetical protein